MNLSEKVGCLLTVEVPGKEMTEETAAFIRECHPGCIALFGRNLVEPGTTTRFIAEMQMLVAEAGSAPLLIGIDQEGGQVAHLRYPCTEMPSQMGRAAAGGAGAAGEAAEILGQEMGQLGFNLAFAPVLDVNTNPANPVIGTRAFSDDPGMVAECGIATIEGLRRAGILSMAKHFPGHGDTNLDSHLGLPTVAHGWERINNVELVPFRAAIEAGVDSICSAHVVFSGIDPSGLPATLSSLLMTDLLRNKLGFQGALFSDALVMHAIAKHNQANIPAAAIRAILAGVDNLMLLGNLAQQRLTFETLLVAAQDGVIPAARLDEAVARVMALRQKVNLSIPQASWPNLAHQAAGERLAHEAVTVVRDEAKLLPLEGEKFGVVEFVTELASPVEGTRSESSDTSTLKLLLSQRYPDIKFLILPSNAPNAGPILDEFIAGCPDVVIATRSAVLDRAQAALLNRAVGAAHSVIQLALRNPYDAMLEPSIGTVLLTYSDHPAGVAAGVEALLGDFLPQGKLPIQLSTR